MIAVDTNLLVYAHRRDSPWHRSAAACIRELAESPSVWAIPWPCIHEFLAIVTHQRIYSPPSSMKDALEQVDSWLESPSLVLLAESDGYRNTLTRLLIESRVSGPRVHDVRIAALCIHANVRELLSADRDFSRFGSLQVRNPLMSERRGSD
ncbi:MAG: PIN domain-containing protein [Proteobacteria bacterium]|nr:PIN domain-containing protein [Pseudomonadota bacterium]